MVITAKKGDFLIIKELYKNIFSDTDYSCDLFFSYMATPENTFIIRKNDIIVSMAFGVIKKFFVQGEIKNAIYICGVGTVPNERGNGYSKIILDYMINFYKEHDIHFFYLVPATLSLFEMYKKYGFSTKFYLNRQQYNITNENIIEPISFDMHNILENYKNQKNKFSVFQIRTELDFKFLLNEFSPKGGCLNYGELGYLFYYIEDDTAYIRETTIADKSIFEGYMRSKFDVNKMVITDAYKGNCYDVPYAMTYGLGNYEKYDCFANLNFD